MRFLKLEILNLASLDRQEGEVIDFEHGALADSTIFSIVGPTGSGKSTLLDAICLALYNRAPRYPRKKGDRNQNIEIFGSPEEGENNRLAPTDSRNILTRGRKNGYSKLTFLANNGMVYRAEWHVRFQRVRYENAQTSLYRISMKDGNQVEESVDWNSLPDIIGLDYEQFLRTVLIAQGSFANFLNAKENERYELLEKLIGGDDTYTRVSEKIDEHRRAAVDNLKEIRAKLSAYEQDDMSEEQLAELNASIAKLEESAAQNRKELDNIKTSLDWYAREDNICKEIKECGNNLELANKAVEALAGQKTRLALHDATLDAVGIYKNIKETEQNIVKLDTDIKSAEEQTNTIKANVDKENSILKKLRENHQTALRELEKQKPHINRARSIKAELKATVKGVDEKKAVVANCKHATTAAQNALDGNLEEISRAEDNVKRNEDTYKVLVSEVEDNTSKLVKSVASATEAYTAEAAKADGLNVVTLQKAKTAADATLSDINSAIKTLQDLNDKKMRLNQNVRELDALKKRNGEIDAEIGSINTEKLKKELDTLRHTHTLMTSNDWQAHRHSLHDGKPCPLCGATDHPYSDDAAFVPVISELAMLIQNKETELERLTQTLTRLTKEQGSVGGSIKQIERTITSTDADVKRITGDWDILHDRHLEWIATSEALGKLLPVAEQSAKDTAKELDLYNALVKRIDSLRKAKEKAEKLLNEYKEESDKKLKSAEQTKNTALTLLATAKGKTENLLAQLKEKKDALAAALADFNDANDNAARMMADMKAEVGDKDPDKYETELTERIKEANDNVTAKTDEITKLDNKLGVLSGKMEAGKKQLLSAEEKLRLCSDELDAWIADFNNMYEGRSITVADISLLYSATDNWEQIRHEMQLKNDALTRANTLLEKVTQEHNEHLATKPSTSFDDLVKRKAELETQSDTELVEKKSRKQRYDYARQQMGKMHESKLLAERTAGEWTAITDAIGADGRTLRKIAQCYTLSFLIAHANAEIRKFNSRYELVQVKHSLGIRVIDHDRADDIRDTTSLSGGETFIVSLGLALGLSALSSRNISFDNLFIDEGFGTLDPDALATVIDSLAMLQSSQGKKVGVISHTDTMSERITTQIRIIKNGNSGSSHIEVYP